MKIVIKNWLSGNVIFECEAESIRDACEQASRAGADLSGADLRSANLRSAILRSADLSGADLRSANLRSADLSGADLRSANLSGADLSGADLSGANLRSANLSGADLSGADLSPVKVDFFDVLLRAPHEVDGLIAALKAGKVDGSAYEGDCCCLVGTIANVRHCNYRNIPNLEPDSQRPAERFFLAISTGDMPKTNPACKLAVEWAEEFQSLIAVAKQAA